MSRDSSSSHIARARLAFITAGDPLPPSPRRGLPSLEPTDSTPEAVPPTDPIGSPSAGSRPTATLRGITRRHVVVVALILLCGVGIAVASLTSSRASPVPLVTPNLATPTPTSVPEPTPMLRVHVLGAVRSPGVVQLPLGSIVDDSLRAAGGLAGDADAGELNLAAPLADGQQVIVGTRGEPRGEVVGASGDSERAGGVVDLNRAPASQLEELPGVGPVLASAIVSHREEHGPFSTVSQLQEVAGIGPKTFARLEPMVTV